MSASSGMWFQGPPRSPKQRYEERRERRRRQIARNLLPITVASIVDADNLFDVYQQVRQGGPAPGIDAVTYRQLSSSEVGDILRKLSATILDGRYGPHATRRVDIPKPGSDQLRRLQLSVICDRVVAAALHRRLNPFWEAIFMPCSYGFREGRNTWQMLAALEAQMEKQNRWVLAVDDIKTAFENVPFDAVLACHETMLGALPVPKTKEEKAESKKQHGRLLAFIETVMRGSEIKRQRGIHQGNPYSPTCLNAVLHYRLDAPLSGIIDSPLQWFRYADNICYLAQSVSDGRSFLRKIRRLLQPLGMTLKGEDGVHDLTRGNEVPLLGFSLSRQRNKVIYGLGKKALDHLAQDLGAAHVTVHPQETAQQSLLGWVDAMGPAFEDGVAAIPVILRLAAAYGFRELVSSQELRQHWEDAWGRWLDTRQRVYCRS